MPVVATLVFPSRYSPESIAYLIRKSLSCQELFSNFLGGKQLTRTFARHRKRRRAVEWSGLSVGALLRVEEVEKKPVSLRALLADRGDGDRGLVHHGALVVADAAADA